MTSIGSAQVNATQLAQGVIAKNAAHFGGAGGGTLTQIAIGNHVGNSATLAPTAAGNGAKIASQLAISYDGHYLKSLDINFGVSDIVVPGSGPVAGFTIQGWAANNNGVNQIHV